MSGLCEFAAENDLEVVAALRVDMLPGVAGGWRMAIARGACRLISMLSGGRLTSEHTCLAVALRKRGG
jgi:hypothetical protein